MFTKTSSIFIVFSGVLICAVQPSLITRELINFINSNQTSWKAGYNFPTHLPLEDITRRLLSEKYLRYATKLPFKTYDEKTFASLPDSFDARSKWPNCPSLNAIRDQGCCGSCWAFGAVTAMTDRVCIASNGSKHFHFSAEDLLACSSPKDGCRGGYITDAWEYWVESGIVSGGEYNSSSGCRPYSIKPPPANS